MFFGLHRRPTKKNSRRRLGLNPLLSYGVIQLLELEQRILFAGAPFQLAFLTPPSQVAAGSPTIFSQLGPIQVAVEDNAGAIVTTDTSKITLLIPFGTGAAPLNGSISGTVTVTAINGVATFSNATFNIPGTYSLTASSSSNLPIFANPNPFTVTSPVSKVNFTTQPIDTTAGAAETIGLSIVDTTGNLVQTDRSTVTLSILSGPAGGTITGGSTVGVFSNGVVSFTNITFNKPGTYKLQAKDSNLSTASTSNSFNVTPGVAAKLGFGLPPVATPGGTPMGPVTVDILDSVGNIVTTDSSEVDLATALGQNSGFIPVAVNAVNGVATFNNLTFPQLGVFTLVATDGTLNSVTSNPFPITGPAAKLVFTRQPSQTTFGLVISPSIIVSVEDAGGNTVPNDNSSVTIAVATGPGAINGTTTVQAVNGVATFTDISLSAEGTYTLNVTDGSLTPATSNNVIINGSASQLVFGVQPSAGAANASITPSVTVFIEDQNGNIVVNNTTSVTIAAGSLTTGGGAILGTTSVSAVNGIATFANLVPNLPGTYTLFATDGSLTPATSNSFVVSAAASLLFFKIGPSDVGQGSVMFPAIEVDILNDAGNVVTSNTTSITIAILDGPSGGTMSGTATVSAVAGKAVFSDLAFSKGGTYDLIAFDGTLATATSDTFVVDAPPAKLKWGGEPQTTVQAGDFLHVVSVTVIDSRNNIVTTDHSVITLAIASGPTGGAIVSGATASADGGAARFNDLKFNIAGTYKLTASDGALTAATSTSFTVTPQISTAHVVVTQNPTSSSLVGKILVSNVRVAIEDQFGNVITNSSAPVKITKLAGNGTLSGSTTVNAIRGLATFTNLSFNQAGTDSLMVQSLNLANPATTSFTTTISQVISSLSKPGTSNPYKAGGTITLSGQLKGLVSSPINWTGGTATALDQNNNVIGTGTVSSSGAVKVTIVGLMPSVYDVRLRYSGDINHIGAISPSARVQVNGTGTTTSVAAISAASTQSTLTLTALITGTGSAPTGNVTFLDGSVIMGTVVLAASTVSAFANIASLTTVVSTLGSHNYTVQYTGDSVFKASSSTLSTTISPVVTTTTTLTSDRPFGVSTASTTDTVTLIATVALNHGNTNVPASHVEFFDNASPIGTLTLNNSLQALLPVVDPTAGVHNFTAQFLGDLDNGVFLPSTSGTLTLTVS